MRVLCVCFEGKNRSRYLAEYLKGKGYETKFGGAKEGAVNPLSQQDIDNSDLIITVRKYIKEILEKRFDVKNKRMITIEVPDVVREYDDKAKEIFERFGDEEFQEQYVRPNLRLQIEPYLPFESKTSY